MRTIFPDWKGRKDLGKQDIMIQVGKRPRRQGQNLQSCHGFLVAAISLHPEKRL